MTLAAPRTLLFLAVVLIDFPKLRPFGNSLAGDVLGSWWAAIYLFDSDETAFIGVASVDVLLADTDTASFQHVDTDKWTRTLKL